MEKYLVREFNAGNVQLFIGSGLSKRHSSVDELRDKLLDDEGFDYPENKKCLRKVLSNGNPSKEISLADAAEFFELYRGSDDLCKFIRENYTSDNDEEPSELHQKLWQLPNTQLIYTTNYDTLIEDAIQRPKQPVSVITKADNLGEVGYSDEVKRIVFKPHGCARLSSNRSDFIISRSDYLNYNYQNPLEVLRTTHDISKKTFLFLGYSLEDINMRHIFNEINRQQAKIKAYAVMRDVSGPEAFYWKKLNVTLIKSDAKAFVDKLLKNFTIDDSEWAKKVEERVVEKKIIAHKAINVINEFIGKKEGDKGNINIILDSGSTTLYLCRALIQLMLNDTRQYKNIIISLFTNSAAIISEISSAKVLPQNIRLISIGGEFIRATRAFVPYNGFKMEMSPMWKKLEEAPTLAFIGLSSIGESELKTNTSGETAVKFAFIEAAKRENVYLLADHSKIRRLQLTGCCFATLSKEMTIITDRKDAYEYEYKDLVKEVK